MAIKNIDHPKHLKRSYRIRVRTEDPRIKIPCTLNLQTHCNLMEISFYKQHTHLSDGRNRSHTQRRINNPLGISYFCQGEVAPITGQCVMCQRDALHAWTHFTLGVRFACKRNFQSDYSSVGRAVFLVNRRSQNTGRSKNFCTDSHLCCVEEVLN